MSREEQNLRDHQENQGEAEGNLCPGTCHVQHCAIRCQKLTRSLKIPPVHPNQ